ncbi:glycosyltransferase family 117 protein, partial [Prevotellamassilia timonensis]|uniref:glycosyltransferase family 117 protein n=1 Tax=Prevotellamassilia timonensis TaxID=1852370 RepID=UPI004027C036
MKQYNLVNNILGWLTFAIAAFTYCSTVEPTASFWDCPEFITTAYKLEVGHPPGAPFFMLTGNFFTQFTSDPTKVAFCVNIMSALLSALCILFLFWTITHLARKLITPDGKVTTLTQLITVMGCGLTGALAYTWSDTFWFSAVEGEVYAYSSMFTALVFWLILKWEDHADEPHSDRWLVLIFYLTGLSIGVHLLNLLCLPAIALVYYYKRNPKANLKGSLVALIVSMLLVAAVLYGVVPGIVKVGGWFEWFFTNDLGMPFNVGMIVYLVALIAVVLTAIWSTTTVNHARTKLLYLLSVALLGIPFMGHGAVSAVLGIVVLIALYVLLGLKGKDGNYFVRKRFLNTSLLCMLMLMIGYSSYAVIVIRSTQNPPMDQNSPEDIFTLGTYMGREQYGSYPLFKGEAFCSQGQAVQVGAINYVKSDRTQRVEKADPSEPDRYEDIEETSGIEYPGGLTMMLPRIWSAAHAQQYQDILGDDLQYKDVTFSDKDGNTYPGQMPTQWSNLKFFLSYQVNFMYWRYFMWNFAGRQNDIQGLGELEHGNWITGIPFIDNAMYGDQSLLPKTLQENKGHNVFYCLPLILGLIGLFFQAYRGEKGVRQFWVVFFLFFMTGLAIVLYLNQTPSQPRERDYAYAGSFYAFAIWIGLGVAALASWAEKLLKSKPQLAAALASVVGVLVPLQMVRQTWDDHDRSNRYTCRAFRANYLNTLPDKGC